MEISTDFMAQVGSAVELGLLGGCQGGVFDSWLSPWLYYQHMLVQFSSLPRPPYAVRAGAR